VKYFTKSIFTVFSSLFANPQRAMNEHNHILKIIKINLIGLITMMSLMQACLFFYQQDFLN
jgi:hypothetical protein